MPLPHPFSARSAIPRALLLAYCSATAGVAQQAAGVDAFAATIRPLLQQYCCDCHSTERHKGDLDLEQFTSIDLVRQQPHVWELVFEQLGNGEMPPAEKPQPEPTQRELLLGYVRGLLGELALADAGDPGPVVLRRLSNAEYTYSIRDLTGLAALTPLREFPADGAAGEGFANVGNALVVSPMLLDKYLQAARDIAAHAVLLPDGISFRAGTARREWTEDVLARLRAFHARFSGADGGSQVNLQGIVFATNDGGRLPLAQYLAASLQLRDAAPTAAAVATVAREHGLSPKYLGLLLQNLQANDASPLLGAVRARWRTAAPSDLAALVTQIEGWQRTLFQFQNVGHIGKVGGPTAWLNALDPVVAQQEFRVPLTPAPGAAGVELHLRADPLLAGGDPDHIVWQAPRLQMAGRPDLPLQSVRHLTAALAATRARGSATATACLAAAAEVDSAAAPTPIASVAQRHGVETGQLERWLGYLGMDGSGAAPITAYLDEPQRDIGGHAFLRGFCQAELPCVMANASDQDVRVPGFVAAHSIAVHPAPNTAVVVGWRAPVAASVSVRATIQHVHTDCGNGVAWTIDLQRGPHRWRVAAGLAVDGAQVASPPLELQIRPGDLLTLRIEPRGSDHTCDLTKVDLAIAAASQPATHWQLAADVADDIQAGNPHADRLGNPAVWHFFSEPESAGANAPAAIPSGSLLARWLATPEPAARQALAAAVGELLAAAPPDDAGAEAALRRQLLAVDGPLCGGWTALLAWPTPTIDAATDAGWGLPPAQLGSAFVAADLHVPVSQLVTVRIPAELAAGAVFVTAARLATPSAGAVRLSITQDTAPAANAPATAGTIVAAAEPLLRARLGAMLDQFRQLFPAALCYAQIVPVDEPVTMTLFHREDQHLRRLMLDDEQAAQLDVLWDELHFVSQDALLMVDVFEQLYQYVTQDGDPSLFEPLREPIRRRAADFTQRLLAAEPRHLEAVLEWAALAFRRPLLAAEQRNLRELYAQLRADELSHDAAIRLLLTRVLWSPTFLYHNEVPAPGPQSAPVSDWELASRLSYFLWSAGPDTELRELAAAGRLHEPEQLQAQTRRLLRDDRVRRLALEFGCAWLHIQGLFELDEKSERHFPTFLGLRGAMQEEAVQFFADLFSRNGSILDLLAADHVFVNSQLAAHYEIPGVEGDAWRRIEGARRFGRGGVLGLAATLSKQSGASRTSPILRGNWVCEVLLGERLPRPPKDVPRLPEDESTATLTMRELTQRHSSDPRCAHCHQRMDAFGLALEEFDGIGRRRTTDLGGRAIDAHATTRDGAQFEGIAGLRDYLLQHRRPDFVRQFTRKLLGYSLGRAVQLADEPLLGAIQADLRANGWRVGRAIERIVDSRQFREIRGRDHAPPR